MLEVRRVKSKALKLFAKGDASKVSPAQAGRIAVKPLKARKAA
jgi:hypothetical protein